jgi:hypothetical protein
MESPPRYPSEKVNAAGSEWFHRFWSALGDADSGEIAYPDRMPLTSACQVTRRLPGLGTDGSVGGQILPGLEPLHGGVGLRAEDSIDRDRVTACPQQILQRPDRVAVRPRGSDGSRLVIGHTSIEAIVGAERGAAVGGLRSRGRMLPHRAHSGISGPTRP